MDKYIQNRLPEHFREPFTKPLKSLSFVPINPRAFRLANVNLARTVNLALRIVVHFLPVGNPARQTTNGKHHREHVRRDAHGAVENARVEVHIRVKLTCNEVIVLESGFFELDSHIQKRIVNVFAFKNLVHELLEHFSTRVVALVNTMTKAGETERIVLVLGLVHHLFNRHAALLDAEERFEHSLVCTTVERAPQGANAGANASVKVSLRAPHHANGRSGAVLFVVRMDNQKRVERLFHDRIRVIRASLAAEHHVQEVAAIAAFRFRVHKRFTDACLVGESGKVCVDFSKIIYRIFKGFPFIKFSYRISEDCKKDKYFLFANEILKIKESIREIL